MGIDTVKLSYSMQDTVPGYRWVQNVGSGEWTSTKNYGTKGLLWWTERVHADGTRVVVKGIGADAHLLWEGSVPKYLKMEGAVEPDCIRLVDAHLREIVHWSLPTPFIRRCDCTRDVFDPEGKLLVAAIGWRPHARSRYTQAVHDNDADGGRTVWLHNKTRGVRVYDTFAEHKEEWARDLTRVEYQVRGDWLGKYGLDRIYEDFARNCDVVAGDITGSLIMRSREM